MATSYRQAASVERIANQLIPEHHPHLVGEPIRYVFRDEHAKKGGKAVMGSARKISGLNAYLALGDETDVEGEDVDPFFVIEIAEDIWARLSLAQRKALVDHELSHCIIEPDAKGAPTLGLVAHDLEEFRTVVERHGLWMPDLVEMARAIDAAPKVPTLFDVSDTSEIIDAVAVAAEAEGHKATRGEDGGLTIDVDRDHLDGVAL